MDHNQYQKFNFELSFMKVQCLDHLHCVWDDSEHFVHFAFHNEFFWCGECTHVLVIGQLVMFPSASLLGCKFYHVFPLHVTNYNGWIYYVVHRFQSISRTEIHLGVHQHLVVYGKCKEFVDNTRRLIVVEVDRTLDVKISVISFEC